MKVYHLINSGGLTGIALNSLISYALSARGKELLHYAKTGYNPRMLLGQYMV